MPWQFGAVAPQSFFKLLKVVPDSTWLAGGAPGADATAGPGGAVAVRSAAMDFDSVPASTWKNRNTLVGTETAVLALTAALMAPTLVSLLKVAGSAVAMT